MDRVIHEQITALMRLSRMEARQTLSAQDQVLVTTITAENAEAFMDHLLSQDVVQQVRLMRSLDHPIVLSLCREWEVEKFSRFTRGCKEYVFKEFE